MAKTLIELAAESHGMTAGEIMSLAESYPAFKHEGPVPRSPEFDRVDRLPRRNWEEEMTPEKIQAISKHYRAKNGKQELFKIQAAALWDLNFNHGLLGGIGTGRGKTILSLLAFLVLHAQRPLLLLPAALIDKTRREMEEIRKNWLIPVYVCIKSYELLGRTQTKSFLDDWHPDVIVCDEAHKLKNPKAAVTRRVGRYMKEHPDTKMVALSGTLTRTSLLDYAHISQWCLKERSPCPIKWEERVIWASALDHSKKDERLATPGVLASWAPADSKDDDELTQARKGYRDRLVQTPGVIMSREGELEQSLIITSELVPMPELSQAIAMLRYENLRPDGEDMMDKTERWRHLMTMSCGFFYRWNPAPPEWWMTPRKAWGKTLRDLLKHNKRDLDSAQEIVDAIIAGHYDRRTDVIEAFAAWNEVKDKYEPQTEAVWCSTRMLDYCADWMEREKGIVWVAHIEFGRELSRRTGVPYYGQRGYDEKGKFIEDHKAHTPIIASIAANKEGRNLQHKWSTNLVPAPPTSGSEWEQMLARTHRYGQTADEVTCLLPISLKEQAAAFHNARNEARFQKDTTGADQKLLYCDVDVILPEEAPTGVGDFVVEKKKKKKE